MIFSEEEIAEIEEYIEFTDGMTIENTEIDGFNQIHAIATGKEDLNKLTNERVKELVQQLSLVRGFFESSGCGDVHILKKITKYLIR